jgi:hypothetical protein
VAIPGMNTTSRPATPDQVRLLIGLSSLMGLPMVAVVMIYVTVNQATPDHGPAWRAFVLALAVGAIVGLVFARFFPLFGGTSPKLAAVRTRFAVHPDRCLRRGRGGWTGSASVRTRNNRLYRWCRRRAGDDLADQLA